MDAVGGQVPVAGGEDANLELEGVIGCKLQAHRRRMAAHFLRRVGAECAVPLADDVRLLVSTASYKTRQALPQLRIVLSCSSSSFDEFLSKMNSRSRYRGDRKDDHNQFDHHWQFILT